MPQSLHLLCSPGWTEATEWLRAENEMSMKEKLNWAQILTKKNSPK